MVYEGQAFIQYTLNLYSALCQLHFNKKGQGGGKRK